MIGQLPLRLGTLAVLVFGIARLSASNAPSEGPYSFRALPARDEIRITDISRAGHPNLPISIARPFVQGEITNFAQASINGIALLTQCDVKNRWPDGSLKFAIVSFVVPSIPANGSVVVSFSNQATGNNAEFLAQPDMLASGYNFDGQIQLTGATSHNISARAMLTTAGACNDPGTDPDSGKFKCTYWLKGPIVTAVIIEDRSGRSFDVNTDGGAGNPLHPIFEAWFYPSDNAVMLGYAVENIWASTIPTSSARAQTYSVTMTGGNSNAVTEYTASGLTDYVRSRWHKVFWLNQPSPFSKVTVDNNYRYWNLTKFTPNYDPALVLAPSLISSTVSSFASSNREILTPLGGKINSGFWPLPQGFSDTGAAWAHGPLSTWDTIYLMSQDPRMRDVVTGNADLGSVIPYFSREADHNAGHGQKFDSSGEPGNVETQGRIISINARTQVSILDTTAQSCNVNYAADWINYGTGGQNVGPYGLGDNLSDSHSGEVAYLAYLTTGQDFYYESVLMQGDFGIAGTKGSRACASPGYSTRNGSMGAMYVDQERQMVWGTEHLAQAAFVAVDSSPEKAYLDHLVKLNVTLMECARGLANDYPENAAACTYGQTNRSGTGTPPSWGVITNSNSLGVWAQGLGGTSGYCSTSSIINQTGSNAPSACDSNFQSAYSALMVGWLNDLGYCPSKCSMLNLIANRYLNEVLNPVANVFDITDYVFPTLDVNGTQPKSWARVQQLYASHTASWPSASSITIDDTYGADSVAAMSYLTGITSSQGGYDGLAAYNKVRAMLVASGAVDQTPGKDFASSSPKWDITPR